MSGLVAIHQPNFFPWLGYFDKIRRADTFIFMDAVDYPRSGSNGMGSWVNRVKFNIQGEAQWITCPLQRMELGTAISAARIDDSKPWRKKLLKTLAANYGKAARYKDILSLLEPLILTDDGMLSRFNERAIRTIAERLGVSAQFVRQSDLAFDGRGTELLISLVKAVGGDAYLAGGGAAGYQKDEMFAEAGVNLIYQKFEPPSYGPPDEFLPGLSVVDYLMHDGRALMSLNREVA